MNNEDIEHLLLHLTELDCYDCSETVNSLIALAQKQINREDSKRDISRRPTANSPAKVQNTGTESNTAVLPVFDNDKKEFLTNVEVTLYNNRPPFCIVLRVGDEEYSALHRKRDMFYVAHRRAQQNV